MFLIWENVKSLAFMNFKDFILNLKVCHATQSDRFTFLVDNIKNKFIFVNLFAISLSN